MVVAHVRLLSEWGRLSTEYGQSARGISTEMLPDQHPPLAGKLGVDFYTDPSIGERLPA
ncbi:hypothetical protein D3C72_2363180 [compost metagenome]